MKADARGARLAARAVRAARRGLRRVGRQGARRRGRSRMARAASPPTPRPIPSSPPEYTRRMAGELPARWRELVGATAAAAHAKAETVASRKASQIALEAFTKALPELLGGSADLTGSNFTNTSHTPPLRFAEDGAVVAGRRRPARPPHQLRRARVRHGGDHERHRPARRLHPVRRHLPDLQRLQPQRDPHGRADEAARRPRLHARLDRPRRGRPDAPVDRARGVAAPDSRTSTSGARATRSRRWSPGPAAIESRDRPTRAAAVAPEPAVCAQAGLRRRRARGRPRRDRQGRLRARRAVAKSACAEGARGDHRDRLRGGSSRCNAQQQLARPENGAIAVRVVSMPSTTVFDRQSDAWKREVLPAGVPRIAVEMGVSDGWWKYGCAAVVGIDSYGESAPAPVLFKHFGFTVENVVATVRAALPALNSLDIRRNSMTIKIGINGFGRIGRMVFRAAVQNFERDRGRRHQRPARARVPRLHAAVRLGARPLQGRRSRSTATPWSSTASASA